MSLHASRMVAYCSHLISDIRSQGSEEILMIKRTKGLIKHSKENVFNEALLGKSCSGKYREMAPYSLLRIHCLNECQKAMDHNEEDNPDY